MTFASIIDKLGIILEDQEQVTFTDVNLVDSLQDCYNEIALETMVLEANTTVSWPYNNAYWRVRNDISDYFAPLAIFNKNTNCWLQSTNFKTLENLDECWDTTYGTPYLFAPVDFNTIAIYPSYQTAPSEGLVIFYAKIAPTVTHDQDVDLEARDVDTLVNGTVADMLDILLEHSKSQLYQEEYYKGIENIKWNKSRRNSADRYHLMAPLYGNMGR